MSQQTWTAVDDYFTDCLIAADPPLDAVLKANTKAGLPAHDVSPTQGKLLHLLVRLKGAKRILEIGTLGAYSTIWLARALPEDGRIVTLEADPKHAQVAAANIERSGLGSRIELRVGLALESLADLHAENSGPFDFIFIDADKPNNPAYLEWALRLSRPGSVIIGDNVVRDGAVVDPDDPDPRVQGVRRFLEMMKADPRLDATALQTVGSKGYDGFTLAIVR
ncbi:Predicted O-methyltransferase YrrM [Granulicella rosea]|uniref:Predicted O-methyltransferase YrrM n=1 Tax=Granulicella rosea TaxID=474952 RepID=A0A239GVZ0_9BACT|nr:O-methyltransferase [Granulicella rosea]SNS73111.1 Predicted O-methyltransferase YrrM [Granulicella rosea]